MADSEVAALTRLIDELNESTGELADRSAEQTQVQLELRQELKAVKDKLPGFVPRRRFWWVIAGVVLAGLLVAAGVVVSRAERQAEDRFTRLAAVARSYGNCEGINRAFEGVDIGYTYLAALSHAQQTTDEGHARIDRAHAALRSGLNRTDCSGHLNGLSPADADKVKAEATRTLPTLPLPPPPTLGPR